MARAGVATSAPAAAMLSALRRMVVNTDVPFRGNETVGNGARSRFLAPEAAGWRLTPNGHPSTATGPRAGRGTIEVCGSPPVDPRGSRRTVSRTSRFDTHGPG